MRSEVAKQHKSVAQAIRTVLLPPVVGAESMAQLAEQKQKIAALETELSTLTAEAARSSDAVVGAKGFLVGVAPARATHGLPAVFGLGANS